MCFIKLAFLHICELLYNLVGWLVQLGNYLPSKAKPFSCTYQASKLARQTRTCTQVQSTQWVVEVQSML